MKSKDEPDENAVLQKIPKEGILIDDRSNRPGYIVLDSEKPNTAPEGIVIDDRSNNPLIQFNEQTGEFTLRQ